MLQEADADRAARLAKVEEGDRRLRELEAAHMADVDKLTALLRESETDRAARFDVIQNLQARIAKIEGAWAWRVYRRLPSSLTGRKPAE